MNFKAQRTILHVHNRFGVCHVRNSEEKQVFYNIILLLRSLIICKLNIGYMKMAGTS